MKKLRIGLLVVCVAAAVVVAVWALRVPIIAALSERFRSSHLIGGGWEVESISRSFGGDSAFQVRLLRKDGSILVEPDVRDFAYCGNDCVLYGTSSQKEWIHFRSACGNRRPALFVPSHAIWRMKGCELFKAEFTDGGEVHVPLFSAEEIKRRAMEQPVASLKGSWFKREYVGNSKDTGGSD